MSEASIRTQFKKGQSGNPKGRPRKPKPLPDQGQTITSIARMLLDQPCQVLGSDSLETRQTRYMRDIAERADLGEPAFMFFLLNSGERGDRRKLQALRAATRARSPEIAAFERRAARDASPETPGLRPDQYHVALPAREVRTEHLKPKPRPKRDPGFFNAKGEPELYNKKGEINPWYLEKVDADPFAHLPKHLPKEEVRASEQARIDEMFRRHREMREADAELRAASDAMRANDAPEIAAKTAPEAVAKPAAKPAEITVPKTGLITGLSGLLRPRQTFDASRKSGLLNGACDFSHLISPRNDDDVPLNGAHVNGKSMNGSSLNGSHTGHA